jgi:hypothetical protein
MHHKTPPTIVKREAAKTQTRWKALRESIVAAREPTANYVKFGKRFINNFQHSFWKGHHTYLIDLRRSFQGSPIAVALQFNSREGEAHTKVAFEARLEFKKNEVFITALQGKNGKARQVKEFEGLVHMPISNYLIKEIEKQAKTNGYHRVVFLAPESMSSYQNPSPLHELNSRGEALMKKFSEKGLSKGEKEELNQILEHTKEKIRKRIFRMYTFAARDLEYTRVGHVFVKNL